MKKLKLREEIKHQANIPDAHMSLEVSRYTAWLSAQTRQHTLTSSRQEMNDYAELAGKTILLGSQKIAVFAPFQPEYSAFRTITGSQTAALTMMVVVWLLGVLIFREAMLVATMAAIIELYLGLILVNVVISLSTFLRSPEEQINEAIIHSLQNVDWPTYTILCPLYKEARVVPQLVQAMQDLSYPTDKLQILLLLEKDDAETHDAIQALSLPSHFKIVALPEGSPRTKPRSCNYGLMRATGQYIVIYDAEDIPEPLQLKKAVLTFANHGPELACVQAKLNFYNPHQNLLTRLFTAEYSLWFDLILPGLQRMGFSIPLGGSSNHLQTRTLRTIGGWDAYNVTEDCDLGLRLSRNNLKTVVLNSVTYEEANSQFTDWLRQRSRWVKGYMQCYLVHMRNPLRYLRSGSPGEFLSLQFMIGGKTAVLFLNPLLWLLVGMYFFLRPVLGDAYQILFPKPLLYLGTFSLIFGNFFYFYLFLVGCVRRKQYRLIKWTLLIPFYWMMMSVAAFRALFQLILKPHYWEKTEHGRQLCGNRPVPDVTMSYTQPLADGPTAYIAPVFNANGHSLIPSITTPLRKAMLLPLLLFSRSELREPQQPKRSVQDPWLILLLTTACIASIAACWYYFQNQDILLYNDAYSHLRIARGIFDSTNPGLTQLGGVWLPLQQVLMLPFVWNDYLWRTGLAGSFPSMASYIVSCIYLYLAARRLTHNSRVSYVGTLIFILNPNILYLQAVPLSETLCIATSMMACYYFLAWIQEDHPKYLIFAAGSTFLATLARYDGWALFFALLVMVGWIGRMKRQKWNEIEGNLILFGVFGGLGIGLWLLWDTVIFGDPLYFQHGQFSPQMQQLVFLQTHSLYTYHDLWQSLRYYTLGSIDTLGPLVCVMAVLSLVIFLYRRRFSLEMFGTVVFLVPFSFYIVSLYTGQAILFIPEAVPMHAAQHLFNTRFCAEIVAPAALFIAISVNRWRLPTNTGFWDILQHIVVVIIIVVQSILITAGGIISLQDGQSGVSCAKHYELNIYLAQHYTRGMILEYAFTSDIDGVDAGIDLKDFVYEASGNLWISALHNPAAFVDWIIMRPEELKRSDDMPDLVAQNIDRQSTAFISQFTLVVQDPTGLQLYHRNGLPSLPTRPVSRDLLTEHVLCGTGGS